MEALLIILPKKSEGQPRTYRHRKLTFICPTGSCLAETSAASLQLKCMSRRVVTETRPIRNIILWTLTEVPEVPEVPRDEEIPSDIPMIRQLTLRRERGLVEILAFLAATIDDPLKIMAVCVEESLTGDSLIIRVATNTGDCTDTVFGFQQIARILKRASKRGESQLRVP